jgi:hypothetical protein
MNWLNVSERGHDRIGMKKVARRSSFEGPDSEKAFVSEGTFVWKNPVVPEQVPSPLPTHFSLIVSVIMEQKMVFLWLAWNWSKQTTF